MKVQDDQQDGRYADAVFITLSSHTGCSGKNCVFSHFTAYIAVRDLQSSQRYASVQSLPLADNFFLQPIAAECWRGRGGKLSRILGKKLNI